ncbi:unnamed protein product [Danaus chrysippus]|uniref:(African queen) hypothetical protein n=1 Tax=Danaus chrysippus TaxID=151541 RepID=A0A8J2W5B8_9NEOP|nr:unnamed protein product [Danaus chrysippus]
MMLGFLTTGGFGYQNRLTLLQQLIECGDVLLGREFVCGLDNRISNSRSSVSPDVVNKDLGLSESDDEVAATTTRLEPILSPIGSGGSPSSGSSSPSDSESESSSAESSPAVAPPAPVPAPQRSSWSLSNFAPPPPPDHADLSNVLADAKGKPVG